MPKKLSKIEIDARLHMYDEAINALGQYESDEPEPIKKAEFEQKQIIIRQLNALADKFLDNHPSRS